MEYEDAAGQVQAVRVETFGVYALFGGAQALATTDDAEGLIRDALAASGAPAPNEIIVHRLEPSSTDDAIWWDEMLKDAEPSAPAPAPAPGPPTAIVFHQESGAHISRYITIIVPA